MSPEPPLTLWASCCRPHDLIDRAAAVTAGGFAGMAATFSDLLAVEEVRGWDVDRVAAELRAREAPVLTFDGYAGWYPGWDPATVTGPAARTLGLGGETALRCAATLGARDISVLAPPDGAAPAPVDELAAAFGAFADQAAEHGLRVQLEFLPPSRVPTLGLALEVVRRAGRDNGGLVLDLFHLGRSGATPEQVAAVPPERVFNLQLNDGPVQPALPDYLQEAMTRRPFAGDGELGAAAYVRALLRDGRPLPPTGPEIALSEVSALPPAEGGRLCAERTRTFLAGLDDGR